MNTITKRNLNLLFVLCSFAGFIIWISGIGSAELSGDEPFSVFHAMLPVHEMIARLSTDNNPPLYELSLHFFIQFFGNAETTVRIPSALFAGLAIFVNAKMMSRFFSQRTALISVAFFIFSNYYLVYARQARAYALFLLLSVCFAFLFLRIIEQDGKTGTFKSLIQKSWRIGVLLVLCTVAILCSHYMSVFLVAISFVFLFVAYFRKLISQNAFFFILLTGFVALLFFLPQAFIFLRNFNKVATNGTWLKAPTIQGLYDQLWRFSNSPVATISLLIPLLYIPAYRRHANNRSFQYITFLLLLSYFLVFIISFKIPVFFDRYLIFIAPFFYNLISVNIDDFLSRYSNKLKYLALLPLLIFIFSFRIKGLPSDHLQEALRYSENENSCYVISPPWYDHTFYYYYERGKYFPEVFDDSNLPPSNVSFEFDLTKTYWNGIGKYAEVNVILSGDPGQSPFEEFNKKITGEGFVLDTVLRINKASNSYVYRKY